MRVNKETNIESSYNEDLGIISYISYNPVTKLVFDGKYDSEGTAVDFVQETGDDKTYNVSNAYLKAIAMLNKGKFSYFVLNNLLVKDNVLTFADFEKEETYFEYVGTTLSDGLYKQKGQSLYLQKGDITEFPKIPDNTTTQNLFRVSTEEIVYHFEKMVNYLSKDYERSSMMNVRIMNDHRGISLVATDAYSGYNVVLKTAKSFMKDGATFLLPNLEKMVRIFKVMECDFVDFYTDPSHQHLTSVCHSGHDLIRIINKLPDGKYPNYEAIYPKREEFNNRKKLSIDRKELVSGLKKIKSTEQYKNRDKKDPLDDMFTFGFDFSGSIYSGRAIKDSFRGNLIFEELENVGVSKVEAAPFKDEEYDSCEVLVMPLVLNKKGSEDEIEDSFFLNIKQIDRFLKKGKQSKINLYVDKHNKSILVDSYNDYVADPSMVSEPSQEQKVIQETAKKEEKISNLYKELLDAANGVDIAIELEEDPIKLEELKKAKKGVLIAIEMI
jgi:hypothetical protein